MRLKGQRSNPTLTLLISVVVLIAIAVVAYVLFIAPR